MKIGIIPSNNGLGHITRSIQLSNYLIKKYSIKLIAPKKKIKKFKLNNKIKTFEFDMNLKIKKNNYNYNWFRNLKINLINKSDLIVSDNLPEILKFHKNSILFANFFWHHILKINPQKKKIINQDIRLSKYPIICNYLFVDKKIIDNFSVKKVGFFGKFKGKKKKCIKNILISIGTAKLENKILKKMKTEIHEMIQKSSVKKFNFYIEPIIFKKLKFSFKKNIFLADYSRDMYKKIDLAIIKPGLGTVTNCLEHSIPMICYLKNFNKEFVHNSNMIVKKKLGFKVFSLKETLNIINKKIDNNFYLNNYYFVCKKKIKWNGEKEIMKLIEKNFS